MSGNVQNHLEFTRKRLKEPVQFWKRKINFPTDETKMKLSHYLSNMWR